MLFLGTGGGRVEVYERGGGGLGGGGSSAVILCSGDCDFLHNFGGLGLGGVASR